MKYLGLSVVYSEFTDICLKKDEIPTGIRCLEALQRDMMLLRGRFDKDCTLQNVLLIPHCTFYTTLHRTFHTAHYKICCHIYTAVNKICSVQCSEVVIKAVKYIKLYCAVSLKQCSALSHVAMQCSVWVRSSGEVPLAWRDATWYNALFNVYSVCSAVQCSVWVLSSWAHGGSCGSVPLGSHPAPSKCLPAQLHYYTLDIAHTTLFSEEKWQTGAVHLSGTPWNSMKRIPKWGKNVKQIRVKCKVQWSRVRGHYTALTLHCTKSEGTNL